MKNLHIQWLHDNRNVDNGSYHIMKANGSLFLSSAIMGRNKKNLANLIDVCAGFNMTDRNSVPVKDHDHKKLRRLQIFHTNSAYRSQT